MKSLRQIILVLLLSVVTLAFAGCATTEAENVSARPWGYRSGYDPGLPSSLNDGR
jgi:hypothetical protein